MARCSRASGTASASAPRTDGETRRPQAGAPYRASIACRRSRRRTLDATSTLTTIVRRARLRPKSACSRQRPQPLPERSSNAHGTREARFLPQLAAGGDAGAAGGVPLPRLPARGHRRRGARLPRRGRRRGGPDRARDADAERRRRAAPLRLEPLLLGLPRPRPLAPDRARLPLLADPHPQRRRRPAGAADREGDRAGGARREDRLHAAAHRPLHAGRQRRRLACSATPTATAPAASPSSTRRRSRSRAAGRTAARRRRSTTTSGTSRARTCSSRPSSASRTPTRRASTSQTSRRAATGSRLHFWNLAEREARADRRPRRERAASARGALAARSRGGGGLRRRCALEHDVALPPRQRRLGRRPGDRRRERSSSRAGPSRCPA